MRFGTAGNSESFYAEKHKHTFEAAAWLENCGITAFEYSFGHGVRLSAESAAKIRAAFDATDIQRSAHAPYYINLNHDPADRERYEKNMAYILDAARLCDAIGGTRVVLHCGSRKGIDSETGIARTLRALRDALGRLEDMDLAHITLCPETMGKINQFGDLGEILRLCQLDERLLPTIDFAHLHALGHGALGSEEDFARVLDAMRSELGYERIRNFHAHFSRIEFTKAGEKRHHTFADTAFGPEFSHLVPVLVEGGYDPVIICESRGTQAEDAAAMRAMAEAYTTQCL